MSLDAARAAARWISTNDVADPFLYAGTAGIVVFLLELHDATGDPQYRQAADDCRCVLLDALDRPECGMYDGIGGIAFALDLLGDDSGVGRAVGLLRSRARRIGRGVLWNDSADIFSGAAGIGLVLIAAARRLGEPALLDLAIDAGVGLIDGGHHRPARMPNFSHGAAGVSFFLATLSAETGDRRFTSAAIEGAERLIAIADTRGHGCRIHHHVPGPGEQPLYYLGWCHGPAGTARLFYRLAQVTGEAIWTEWVHRCARSILSSGIPDRPAPGLWNNVGQCCGLAGIADFLLSLDTVDDDAERRAFADRIVDRILARAEPHGGGLRWTHAEHRTRPDDLEAQTGYMQGAAGIGALLVRADPGGRGRSTRIRFPDSPW